MAAETLTGLKSGKTFTIVRQIGNTNHSIVTEATGDDGKAYAIKRPKDEIGRSILPREAERQAQFSDPHITPIVLYDRSPDDFLVTPLADCDLEYYLSNNVVKPEDAFLISAAIAHALHTMHEKKIKYGDLHPKNVLIQNTPDGPVAQLTDFGSALYFSEPDQDTLWTPFYAPPERRLEDLYLPAGDQYLLASATIYPAFTGESVMSKYWPYPRTMEEIIGGKKMTYLHDVAQVVADKALQAKPKDRYSSMGALDDDLTERRAKAEEQYRKRRVYLPGLSRLLRD